MATDLEAAARTIIDEPQSRAKHGIAAHKLAVEYLRTASLASDEQCFQLNAHQHSHDFHPYTCGNGCRRIPLIATRQGWRCADCDYMQDIRPDGVIERRSLGIPLAEGKE